MRPINLLPPDVAEQRVRRRKALSLAVLAVLYVVLLGAGVVYWNMRVADARDEVAAQEEINGSLRREAAALAGAEVLQAQFQAKAMLVRSALATDVDWGILLNDLARLLPPRVWVQEFTGAVAADQPGALGVVTFRGVGFDYPDVSAWLRALDSEDFSGITGTWVSTAAEGQIGDTVVVTFSSSAVLTSGAVTDRADELIPEVP